MPKDYAAIQRIITAIDTITVQFPFLRVGQVIANALPERLGGDTFYVTDRELADCLESYLSTLGGK